MVTFLSAHELNIQLDKVQVIGSDIVGAERRNYSQLSSEDFELLLYDIYQKSQERFGWYDNARLMIVGADQGRDVWLTCNELPVGLIQCKRVKSAFTAPDTLREIIKFLLNAELYATLLPDPSRFLFILAVSSDPAATTTDFFQTPQLWLKNHEGELLDLIHGVISSYENFSDLNGISLLPKINSALNLMHYELIRPVDLDGFLHALPQVSSRFFREKLVIDIEANQLAVDKAVKQGLTDWHTKTQLTSLVDLRSLFAGTSAIGRTWRTDIAGEYIQNPVFHKVLAAINEKKRSILVLGQPGSGKTCVMLAVQEELERQSKTRSDLVPLFIQSREFADFATAEERQAQGLSEKWVEEVACMAKEAHVVIVIDSLDVLSIAREYIVLKYFLAQIDRLLLIPNVSVVTACRDFDRHFDRRIAERKWDCELKCVPLNWESEIEPLLNRLTIDVTTIDVVTRVLISNPYELALFVDLAKRGGSFNVVTSQALAQRYINTIVKDNDKLGNDAVLAIESMAGEMLKLRSLSMPQQRFIGSEGIQRILLSHNVLHESQDGKLTFGHQTLLDVLVISAAVRKGISLNDFIQSLPPVPFVRPSIRSFVAQLAIGDRRDYRKQLRTVLEGNAAFHIRRLVAESFAEQPPQDEDWPLLRDLRNQHRDVFQVIYTQAISIDWHHFWFSHLVPVLKDSRDSEGLIAHVHWVARWANKDIARVIQFWSDALELNWVEGNWIANQLSHTLASINVKNAAILAPLLEKLLNMPRQQHGFLGKAIAQCVTTGGVDDQLLWQYIAGDICDSDVLGSSFGGKLHCQSYEFGYSNEDFFRLRMEQSSELLDLAVQSIEKWSRIRITAKGLRKAGRYGFLGNTSYKKAHSQNSFGHVGSEDILLDAIETAILHHARMHSDWWQGNCQRLCFSHEGALRYFGILACIEFPIKNIDLIELVLSEKDALTSDISYELGSLIQTAFIYINPLVQDSLFKIILTIREEDWTNKEYHFLILKERAELIITIPCYLRSAEAQAMLVSYEKIAGPLVRQPDIQSSGGIVHAPFSFGVFLSSSDINVLGLLSHYNGDSQRFDDLLIGGAQEVGCQLSEAASRHPLRFLKLLSTHWADISARFFDDIMDGVSRYLAHRFGNLQSNAEWTPIDEPDAPVLAQLILDELERHPAHWHCNRSVSNSLQACAHVINDKQESERLVFLAIAFATMTEESSISGPRVNLLDIGINLKKGHVAEALVILLNQLHEKNIQLPELLVPALRRFAGDEHPAVRAVILRHLDYVQSYNPELGWELYHLVMQGDATGLWQIAEPCLYYASQNDFAKVEPLLQRLRHEGGGNDLATWGRISALAGLVGHIKLSVLLDDLSAINTAEAWSAAAEVWTHPENVQQQCDYCFDGIRAGLNVCNTYALVVAEQINSLFGSSTTLVFIPADLIRQCFFIFKNNCKNTSSVVFGFDEWLNAISLSDSEYALTVAEIYLDYVSSTQVDLYDHNNNFTQLLTLFFSEAEEREESDQGEMLRRVVALQDKLLSLGVNGINEWLKAAEERL